MTPRRFSPDTVQAKLQLMGQVLDNLGSVRSVTAARLQSDHILRAAVERYLCQLVDLAVAVNAHIAATVLDEVPGDYHRTFASDAKAGAITEDLAAELAPSTGLRNILVHDYVEVDLTKVAEAVPLALDGYRRYRSAVAGFAAARASSNELQ